MIGYPSDIALREIQTYKSLLEKRAMLMLVVNVDQPGFDRSRITQYVLLVNDIV